MFVRLVCILVLVNIYNITFSIEDDTCKNVVKRLFEKLSNNEKISENGMYVEYISSLCLNEQNGNHCGIDSARLSLKGKKYVLVNKNSNIYRDDNSQVVILKDKKQIIITAGKVVDKEKVPHFNLSGIHDSIINSAVFSNCDFVIKNGERCIYTELTLPVNLQKKLGVSLVKYLIKIEKLEILSIEIFYTDGLPYKNMKIDVKEFNYNLEGEVFSGSILDRVYDKNGKILQEFKDFQVIDSRVDK